MWLVMQFQIGDIVHNKTTGEEGCIVRISELGDNRPCYIVSVPVDQTIWHAPSREVIWERSEVSK
jgi:hypothetical protein